MTRDIFNFKTCLYETIDVFSFYENLTAEEIHKDPNAKLYGMDNITGQLVFQMSSEDYALLTQPSNPTKIITNPKGYDITTESFIRIKFDDLNKLLKDLTHGKTYVSKHATSLINKNDAAKNIREVDSTKARFAGSLMDENSPFKVLSAYFNVSIMGITDDETDNNYVYLNYEPKTN